jgi:serine phosphatase RsbU (regulator of sigma subunit)
MDADGVMFGAEGAVDFIRGSEQRTAAELVHGLCAAARAFGDELRQDDMMSIVCKVR